MSLVASNAAQELMSSNLCPLTLELVVLIHHLRRGSEGLWLRPCQMQGRLQGRRTLTHWTVWRCGCGTLVMASCGTVSMPSTPVRSNTWCVRSGNTRKTIVRPGWKEAETGKWRACSSVSACSGCATLTWQQEDIWMSWWIGLAQRPSIPAKKRMHCSGC